ncbi:MAG: hypothetical protein M3390_07785, partial [Chloroflexota bacterium]|nr:hypothetical protein [Chloroflexota bacterium]
MPDTLTSIQDWAATLPGLESSQPEVTFKYERDGVRSYTLAAGDNRMRFKHYLDKPGTRPSLV